MRCDVPWMVVTVYLCTLYAITTGQGDFKARPDQSGATSNSKVKLKDAPSDQLSTSSLSLTSNESNATGDDSSNSSTSNPIPMTSTTPLIFEKECKPPAEAEHQSSMAIFFILLIIVVCILLVHCLLVTNFHYLPESVAVIALGILIGLILKLSGSDWKDEETLPTNAFFLLLLPPILFEAGYNLHKGNFFANIGSILVFAVLGTVVSASVFGGGIYLLGEAQLVYKLGLRQSLALGSLVSAVDPVATLAIFASLDADPLLYMLVFGESMLNDAVSIVLTTTIMEAGTSNDSSVFLVILGGCGNFLMVFVGSAALGAVAALMSALLLKFIDLRRTPSLELGTLICFAYLPYGLAEGLHLSGIMAILFCGIVMSHYTHYSLSPSTQMTMQLLLRTAAFISETCVFAYLGMAVFTFPLTFQPEFAVWTVVLCLVGRAMNIFPFSYLLNHFRDHKITKKMQFIMWFSGLRGAIAFALSVHTGFDGDARRLIITSTLILVLFTTVILGGSTMPLMKLLQRLEDSAALRSSNKARRTRSRRGRNRSRNRTDVTLSKTKEFGSALDTMGEYTESEDRSSSRSRKTDSSTTQVTTESQTSSQKSTIGDQRQPARVRGFAKIDEKFFRPFFIRKFTSTEKRAGAKPLADMAAQFLQLDSLSEDEIDLSNSVTIHTSRNGSSMDNIEMEPLVK